MGYAGSGVKEFFADRDAEYFIALGNLNRVDTEVRSIHVLSRYVYSMSLHEFLCSCIQTSSSRLCTWTLLYVCLGFR